jgi:hypothetical protein
MSETTCTATVVHFPGLPAIVDGELAGLRSTATA